MIHDRHQKTHPSLSAHNLIFKIKYLLYYSFFVRRCPLPLIFVKPDGFFYRDCFLFFFVSCRQLVVKIQYFFHLSNVLWFRRPFHHLAVVNWLLPGYKPLTVFFIVRSISIFLSGIWQNRKRQLTNQDPWFQENNHFLQNVFCWVKINVFLNVKIKFIFFKKYIYK